MKDMTTAEFAKANLAALEEPVKIRRYTKTVGTYYPEGYEPAQQAHPAQIDFDLTAAAVDVAAEKIRGLEDEVARLKRELAARPQAPDPKGAGYRPEHPLKDVFAGLAKQDREFFERKLGKGKK